LYVCVFVCVCGIAMVQWCYNGVLVMHRGGFLGGGGGGLDRTDGGLGGRLRVLQWCYRGDTVVLQWCYNGITVVSQRCDSDVIEVGLIAQVDRQTLVAGLVTAFLGMATAFLGIRLMMGSWQTKRHR
jgi:hypothetical protein